MHHRLHAGLDRRKSTQPQQVQGCGPQRGDRLGAIAPVAMGVLLQLGVADPIPADLGPDKPKYEGGFAKTSRVSCTFLQPAPLRKYIWTNSGRKLHITSLLPRASLRDAALSCWA